jgi:anti-sigma B factor antagonist
MRHDETTTHAPLVLGSAQLTTTTEPARGMVVVHVTGEVDVANSAPLPDALLEACAADSDGRTELDVSALAFCDLSGARALLEACRRLTIAGTCAKVRGAGTQLRWLLSFIGAEPDLFVDPPAPTTLALPLRTVPADRAPGPPGQARREHPVVPRHRLPGKTSPLLD